MADQPTGLGQRQPRILVRQADRNLLGHRAERLGHHVGAPEVKQLLDRCPLLAPHVRAERATHVSRRFLQDTGPLVPGSSLRRAELLQELQFQMILKDLVITVAEAVIGADEQLPFFEFA